MPLSVSDSINYLSTYTVTTSPTLEEKQEAITQRRSVKRSFQKNVAIFTGNTRDGASFSGNQVMGVQINENMTPLQAVSLVFGKIFQSS